MLNNNKTSASFAKRDCVCESKDLALGKALDIWLDGKTRSVKGSTILKYSQLIENHIKPEIGAYKISQLNSDLIETCINKKLKTISNNGAGCLSGSYVKTMAIIINSALRDCGYTDFNINKSTNLKLVSVRREIEVLDTKTIIKLERYCNMSTDEVTLGIMLALQAGLRLGEICALCWDDIDLKNNVLYVRKTLTRVKVNSKYPDTISKVEIGAPKSISSMRAIPLTIKLSTFLKKNFNSLGSSFVLNSKDDFMKPRTFEYRFQKFLKNAGVGRFNFHVLRHTFATRCIEAGVDVKTLSEILGHSSIATTLNIYTHLSINSKRAQLEKINSSDR